MNELRKKIENGNKLSATLVSLTDPCLCEIMGNIGYDFVWIDMEHTYMSYKEVLCHLNACRSSGTCSVVRLPQDDLTVTKKILEMGPEGIIFPMVRDIDELKRLIGTTLYPPLGTRGFGPMRAIGYGSEDAKEYTDTKSLELCRFVQIEHIDFIDNLEEICKIPYIDGFIFGPNDLSASLGDFMNVYDDKTVNEIKRAIEILRSNGKYIGLAGSMAEDAIRFWSGFDIDMLVMGADWNFVYESGKNTLANLRKYHKEI